VPSEKETTMNINVSGKKDGHRSLDSSMKEVEIGHLP
jgi:hypothetical protein